MNILSVLFLHQSWKSFERQDYEILKRNFPTEEILVYRDFLFKLPSILHKLKKVDVVFCWFAYRTAFLTLVLAKLLRKKIILVMGGWDCANEPEINYGAMMRGWRNIFTRIITKSIAAMADRIIAVSKYNRKEIIINVGIPEDKISLIYHGFYVECCQDEMLNDKEDMVLTVADVNEKNFLRKGIRFFIEVSHKMPEVDFVLAGRIDEKLRKPLLRLKPCNLTITDYLNSETLHRFYRKAMVYAQLSFHEQFGCALAEAMLHRCVPVITDKAALPEIAGDNSFYVPYGDIKKTIKAIREALKDNGKSQRARRQIIENFSLQEREIKLVNMIKELTKKRC